MPSFEHTVEIAAPIERVFAFDSNPENWSRTMASLRDLEIVEETDDGARMRATYKLLGISLDVELALSVVEPNEHMTVAMEGSGMKGEVHNYFAETASGTRITHQADYEFGDSLRDRLLEPVASRYNNRQFKNHLQNTKDIIEAEIAAETARPA
ncbi:Carbon monoxide dehydrogenase subunit G [Halopelagius inordinatus]|uniref:Carbon monoxide dehydrogenase subunit G n=1 Tax=Halopelagius inordinatus TaxID=553467 RepID=A0A1I2PBT2_9EURY|nr:SRPBCC family protein [Halopelagius inordinatus]SFG11417.1 Carbon monoxide dehydrogenase subunit G [Halopelagius inordinatus]